MCVCILVSTPITYRGRNARDKVENFARHNSGNKDDVHILTHTDRIKARSHSNSRLSSSWIGNVFALYEQSVSGIEFTYKRF